MFGSRIAVKCSASDPCGEGLRGADHPQRNLPVSEREPHHDHVLHHQQIHPDLSIRSGSSLRSRGADRCAAAREDPSHSRRGDQGAAGRVLGLAAACVVEGQRGAADDGDSLAGHDGEHGRFDYRSDDQAADMVTGNAAQPENASAKNYQENTLSGSTSPALDPSMYCG